MKLLLKIFAGIVGIIAIVGVFALTIGLGWWGDENGPGVINKIPVPDAAVAERATRQAEAQQALALTGEAKQILFGDLHVHTSYSLDAYTFGLPIVTGLGMTPPADACDFARYCSALDFWSINDHAEALTPRIWNDTIKSIQQCNAVAEDPENPDTVAFLGFEWSQGGEAASHYGHKNVIFREIETNRVPPRPIASTESYVMLSLVPPIARGALALTGHFKEYADYNAYSQEAKAVPTCAAGVDTKELPSDCREVARTPTELYAKLDQLGFDSTVIPHGLAWGRTNPADADFQTQMAELNPAKQKLLEVYSGHGTSEQFADWQRSEINAEGVVTCPEPNDEFLPCCWQAGELIRERCDDSASAECETLVEKARRIFVEAESGKGSFVVQGAEPQEWGRCGQLLNAFMPAYDYIPKMSAQYNLALGDFSKGEKPQRFRFGMMASSDNHKARAGAYKEFDRLWTTDSKEVGSAGGLLGDTQGERLAEPSEVEDVSFVKTITRTSRLGSFYYGGGLVAAHSSGRDRDAIWQSLQNKEVYATSGERILLWFDLLNSKQGEVPMGSEVTLNATPRFRVRAAGAYQQKPGCPDYVNSAVPADRLSQLCHGECYNPGDERKRISRIEVVRITPQLTPTEEIAPLIDNAWKTFECEPESNGCVVEFEDPEFIQQGRETVYYVRAIQEPSPAVNGDPFHCEYDEQGNCVKTNFCVGKEADIDNDCLGPAEERAWSSPIFIDYRAPSGANET